MEGLRQCGGEEHREAADYGDGYHLLGQDEEGDIYGLLCAYVLP